MSKISKKSFLYTWIESNPLRAWRRKNKFTLEQGAASLGVSRQVIYSWESGQSIPSAVNFDKLKNILSVSLQDWITWKEGRPSPLEGRPLT